MQPKVIDVAAGIVLQDGKVLVARRRESDHLGGLWEFPGGKIEAGETPEEALRRELVEELGVEVRVGPLWGILSHRYPERSVRLHFLFAWIERGEPRAAAAEELRWAAPPELAELPFPGADRPLVTALLRSHREGLPLHHSRLPASREETA
jgi:8-oxo-dGTP diphosphatase